LPDSKLLSFASPKESNQRKGAPGLPPASRVPSISHKRAGLRNSHDPLRGHVLKQCSPNPTARSRLIEAAYRGNERRRCVRSAHGLFIDYQRSGAALVMPKPVAYIFSKNI
jgi:hypothetical protein